MPQAQFKTTAQATLKRRSFLGVGAIGLGAIGMWPEVQTFAADAQDFLIGPPVKDIPPIQVSKHVWMIFAPDGFPTQENRGMMSNISFVVTSAGVVILDSGSSLQIGQMAIRMIKKVTPLPVVAVFNSHFHGDHWLGNHAFVEEYGTQLPIYALAKTIETIKGIEGNTWRILMERWTNQSTAGTKTVAPNRVVTHGQKIKIGNIDFVMHHYGRAHTDADLSVQVIQEKVTALVTLPWPTELPISTTALTQAPSNTTKPCQKALANKSGYQDMVNRPKICFRPMVNSCLASGSHVCRPSKTANPKQKPRPWS